MNLHHYRVALQIAGDWARGACSSSIRALDIPRIRASVGIYFGCRSDGRLLYIGSAVRPLNPHGVAHRILEHPLKVRERWWYVWVLPLYDDTPPTIVRAIEGQIIDCLSPPLNIRRHHAQSIPPRLKTTP